MARIRDFQNYVWQTMEEKGFHVANENTIRMHVMARLAYVYNGVTEIVQVVKRTWSDGPTRTQHAAYMQSLSMPRAADDYDVPDDADAHIGILARLSLIHTEVSEAAEVAGDKEKFGEELADIVIRVMDLAGSENIDLEAAMIAKMEKNAARPFRYGTKNALQEAPHV